MKHIKFDIMVGEYFYRTLTMPLHEDECFSVEKVKCYVMKMLPSMKKKDFKIFFCNN